MASVPRRKIENNRKGKLQLTLAKVLDRNVKKESADTMGNYTLLIPSMKRHPWLCCVGSTSHPLRSEALGCPPLGFRLHLAQPWLICRSSCDHPVPRPALELQ